MRWLLLLCLLFAWPGQAEAVTISVDLSKALLSWDAGLVDATHAAAATYNVKCGGATGVYTITFIVTAPALTALVKNVVNAPGTYFCAVTAGNSFGESALSNEVNFQAGYSPATPATLRLVP